MLIEHFPLTSSCAWFGHYLQENKRLSEPLAKALADVAELNAQLKEQEKDRTSLANTKARLREIDEQVREVQKEGGGGVRVSPCLPSLYND